MKFKVTHLIFSIFVILLFTQCTPDKKPETGINTQSNTEEESQQAALPKATQKSNVSDEQTVNVPAVGSNTGSGVGSNTGSGVGSHTDSGTDAGNDTTSPSVTAENETDGVPALYIAEKLYKFEPVYDGIYIEHDFIIENRGTSELKIIKAKGT